MLFSVHLYCCMCFGAVSNDMDFCKQGVVVSNCSCIEELIVCLFLGKIKLICRFFTTNSHVSYFIVALRSRSMNVIRAPETQIPLIDKYQLSSILFHKIMCKVE